MLNTAGYLGERVKSHGPCLGTVAVGLERDPFSKWKRMACRPPASDQSAESLKNVGRTGLSVTFKNSLQRQSVPRVYAAATPDSCDSDCFKNTTISEEQILNHSLTMKIIGRVELFLL